MLSHFNSPVVTNMQDLTLSLHLDSESRRELEIEKFSVFFWGGGAETFMDILMFYSLSIPASVS